MESENLVASALIISSSSTDNESLHPGATVVVISYPKDWDKPKMFEDGKEVHTSKEIAEHFVNIGIGKLKSEDEKSEDEKPKDYSAFDIAKAKEELQKRQLSFAHNSKLETLIALLVKDDEAKKAQA